MLTRNILGAEVREMLSSTWMSNYYSSLLSTYGTTAYSPYSTSSTSSTNSTLASLTSTTASSSSLLSDLQKTYTTAKEVRSAFSSLQSVAGSLVSALSGNVFGKRTVDTGTSTAISGTATNKATKASYSVGISKLAQADQNTGTALSSNSLTSISAGTHTFGITVGGKTKNVSVNIGASDTNQTALNSMAKAINSSGAGVSARVDTKSVYGQMQSNIVITANKTGTDSAFTLKSGTGNILSVTGADNKTTAAQNASYSVNGTTYSSQSNQVTLDNGNVTLDLNKTTTSPVTMKVGYDTKAVSDQISSFVDQYNSTVETLNSDAGTVNGNLLKNLTSFASSHSRSLSDIGISINSKDQTLSLDKDKLAQALSDNPDKVNSLIGGSSGLATWVSGKSRSVASSSNSSIIDQTYSREQRTNTSALIKQQLSEYLYNATMNMFSNSTSKTGNLINLLG
jgi:flagellar hook-associated protein 2